MAFSVCFRRDLDLCYYYCYKSITARFCRKGVACGNGRNDARRRLRSSDKAHLRGLITFTGMFAIAYRRTNYTITGGITAKNPVNFSQRRAAGTTVHSWRKRHVFQTYSARSRLYALHAHSTRRTRILISRLGYYG